MSTFASRAWLPRRSRVGPFLKKAVLWTGFWFLIVFLALFIALAVAVIPMLAAVPVVLAVSWLFARRWPVATFAILIALSGGFWTIEQFTKLPTGPTADAMLIGVWVAGIQALIAENRPGVKRLWPGAIGATLFCFVALLFVFVAEDAFAALYTWRLSYWYIVAAVLLAYVPMKDGALWLLTRVALVVIAVVAAYALVRWVIGPSARETGYVEQNASYEKINGELRLFGSMGAGHILSSWMAPLTVFGFGLALGLRGPWRVFSLIVAGMCGAALIGTDVRAGQAAAGIGGAFVIAVGLAAWTLGPRRLAAIGVAGLFAFCGLAVIIDTQVGKESEQSLRFEAILAPENDVSFQARLGKWETALADIKHHPFGDGLGQSGLASKKYGRFQTVSTIEIDSSYLKIAIEQGFAFMLLFAFVLILMLMGLTREAIEGPDRLGSTIALGAAGALLAYAIQLGFGSYIEGIAALGVWLIIGLGMRATSRREPAAGNQPAPV